MLWPTLPLRLLITVYALVSLNFPPKRATLLDFAKDVATIIESLEWTIDSKKNQGLVLPGLLNARQSFLKSARQRS